MKRVLLGCLCALPAAVTTAGELAIGATRDEVIAQLGAPKSKLNSGSREIYGYPNGRITLVDGKVASIDLKSGPPTSSAPAAPPAPVAEKAARPAPAAVRAVAKPVAQRDIWRTDFAAAQKEAADGQKRLLVLFTGSDWCPPCIQFEANVAHAPAFLEVAQPAFVLVKLDYPRNTPQPAAVRARNEELRKRYGVNSYPSLLVISPDGSKSARVETNRSRPAKDIVDFFTQAVDEARRAKEKSSFWPW